jgi:hydrogenase-1 operon protein HyaF
LLAEINDKVAGSVEGAQAHVINLTLLPQTEQDLACLERQLGQGSVSILSRGYGNCRISSTATRNVWWVRYYNSQDRNILNSLEITGVPGVACAAQEDIRDSAERLQEILDLYA